MGTSIQLQDRGLYIGQRQIHWSQGLNLSVVPDCHSILFDEKMGLPSNANLQLPKYLRTRGVTLIDQNVSWEYVELEYSPETREIFFRALPKLKSPNDFVIYPLNEQTLKDFEATLKAMNSANPHVVLVLQPEEGAHDLFALQQLAQKYFPETRVIPKVNFAPVN